MGDLNAKEHGHDLQDLETMAKFREGLAKFEGDLSKAFNGQGEDAIVWVAVGNNGASVKVKKAKHRCSDCGKLHVIQGA